MSNQPMRLKPKRNLDWEADNTPAPSQKRRHKLLVNKNKPQSTHGERPRAGKPKKAGKDKGRGFQSGLSGLARLIRRPQFAQACLAVCFCALSFLYAANLNQEATTVLAHKRELPVYCVEREDKVLSISFDASWGGEQTLKLLDILDEYDVKTTFFLVGIWVDKYPELVKEIVARGHEIGNHSASHPHMTQISEEKMKEELRIMSDKVETITGVRPTLFRPPYGDYNDQVVQVSRKEGYEAVQWNVDSLDWKNRGVQDIINRCTKAVNPGDIVLFHNDAQYTVEALPTVLKHYQDLGYKVIPVSQILLTGETTIDVQGRQHKAPAAPAT